MKKKYWIAGGLVLVAVIVAGIVLLLLPSRGQEHTATVVEAVNKVDAHPRPKDGWEPAIVDMLIYGGGQVRTRAESSARLELLEGLVRLSADSIFTVKESVTRQGTLLTTLFLQEGRLWVHLTTDQPHEFTVETGNAAAAVRDTRFSVKVADGETLVSVAEGEVELIAQEQSVTVAEEEQAIVKPDQPPSPPEPLSTEERALWAIEGEMPELAPEDVHIITDGTWKFSRDPSTGWQQQDYDDSGWTAVDGEPCQEFPGAEPACLWDYPYRYVPNNTLYFRTIFDVAYVPSRARIVTLVDDDVDIYLNGTLVLHDGEDVGTSGISWWEADVTDLIRSGTNILAFRGVDTGEGTAYVQAALGLCFGTEDTYDPIVQIMNHWEEWFDGDIYIEAVDAPCDAGVVEVAYRVDGGPWQIVKPHEGFQLPPGEHDVEARATDGAGRQGFDSWHFRIGQP